MDDLIDYMATLVPGAQPPSGDGYAELPGYPPALPPKTKQRNGEATPVRDGHHEEPNRPLPPPPPPPVVPPRIKKEMKKAQQVGHLIRELKDLQTVLLYEMLGRSFEERHP